ncbi:hypothetical protein B4Q04_18325 [Zobellia sp. OII3]|uniref:Rha family transcriptional regulator n=1 Tax=Zobellia sp. OII3 TaxID=2034520 RepID=UPI000B52DF8F|nr:Rha family transcriptional regulator [Zobellia sp. OII3]OWW24060.1 hypothetical protein B4Q04_18325 [Zobellia sp. OII3]
MATMDITLINDCITSRDLAEFTRKRHSDVLRDIREMEKSWKNYTKRSFSLSDYNDRTGRKQPMYKLEKREILFILSKYDDELRAMIIIRLDHLEQKEKERVRIMEIELSYVDNRSDIEERHPKRKW